MTTKILPQGAPPDTPAERVTAPEPTTTWDPDAGPVQFAPGVMVERWCWGDIYTGKIEAMVAAGLVHANRIPGAPGMAKTMHSILPDGEIAPKNTSIRYTPGGKSVQRMGGRLRVHVSISKEEERARDAARDAAREALREAEKQLEKDRVARLSDAEREEEFADSFMRKGPESFLKSMPKTAMDVRRKLIDDFRWHVRRQVREAATPRPNHGFVLDADAVDPILLSVDAVVEAVLAAEVKFDEARHTAIKHKLHGYMVANGTGTAKAVAQVTKPNPSLLSETTS